MPTGRTLYMDEHESIRQLAREGLKDREIAQRVGCAVSSVEKIRRAAGIKRRPRRHRKPVAPSSAVQ